MERKNLRSIDLSWCPIENVRVGAKLRLPKARRSSRLRGLGRSPRNRSDLEHFVAKLGRPTFGDLANLRFLTIKSISKGIFINKKLDL